MSPGHEITTNAVVISNDLILRSETRAILSELDIACTCSGFAGLAQTLSSNKFDCVFLDFNDRDRALSAIQKVRTDKLSRYAIVFALSDSECEPVMGISYSVCCSRDFPQELKQSFLSARSLVLGEKRRFQRHPVDLKVSCICGDRLTQARMIDLSERGACLELLSPTVPILQLSFVLPGIECQIQTEVKVAWRENGKAGVQFVSISDSCRAALRSWLTNSLVLSA